MINLSSETPLWLVDDEQVQCEFKRAVAFVRKAYSSLSGDSSVNYTVASKIRNVFSSSLSVDTWGRAQIEATLSFTFRGSQTRLCDIDRELRSVPSTYHDPLSAFFRLVFVVLWARRVLLAPLAMQTIVHNDGVFDHLCEELDVECLKMIRGIHPKSNLPSIFKRGEFNDGSSRVNFWVRLLFSTDFYTVGEMNRVDCQKLFDNCYGNGDKPLRRYFVADFLLMLAHPFQEKKEMAVDIVEQYKSAKDDRKVQAAKRKKERDKLPRSRIKIGASSFNVALAEARSAALELSRGTRPFDFEKIFKTLFGQHRIKPLFNTKSKDGGDSIYESMHPVIRSFVGLVDGMFRSYLLSKRLQRASNHIMVLNLFLSYLSCYLPGYYLARDGSLEGYPKNLKDFNCTIFFTRQHIFTEGFLQYKKEPPMTFLKYMELYASEHGWVNETQYSRVLIVDDFCTYVQSNREILPDANLFTNNFSASCYPSIEKRAGTVKKIIPRDYFSTFLSMLYSLEYLVMHINLMAAGEMRGVLGGQLHQPVLQDLLESHAWAGLLSKETRGVGSVNLDLLNYCPIFYHDGVVQRMEFLPRFYSVIDYEIEGNLLKMISPNEIRITQLMCETGLRQHHIVWLDKERYDCVMDSYSKSQLAPLFVSSDKSHGEWTAIVSRHVVDVMHRQRAWYDKCSHPSYAENIWYGGVEGSKFGQYKPLFRRPGEGVSDSNWKNYRYFPMYMLMLQYFIRETIGDCSGEPLVYLKGEGKTRLEIDSYDATFLGKISMADLTSPHTPHALRAGFVSEAIRFLPPSIIGQFMTGQTEELVWYYAIFDGKSMPDHQKLLADYLNKNMDALGQGDAPELAQAVLEMNTRLMKSIQVDAVKAIQTLGLISLTGVKEGESGIEVLRAKRYTKLAYNNCHICPFDNRCPKEVVEKFGVGRPCALCPYAIRGVDHLGAISAEKDKAKEMMISVLRHIDEYRALKARARNPRTLEDLNAEYDRHAREAYALEAIEQQLYQMARSGQLQSFFMKESVGLAAHYEKISLTEGEHLIKRLIDVQNFPDVTSSHLDTKFAYMRTSLLMSKGRFEEILKPDFSSPAHQLASQVGSMLTTGALQVQDVFRIGRATEQLQYMEKPKQDIGVRIGLVPLEHE